MTPVRDVLIVGAGPSGLATAIAAQQLGLDCLVVEQGSLVDAIRRMPRNMVFFTTPELLEIGGVPFTTPHEKPTRVEALTYYRKVTDLFGLQVALFQEVVSVGSGGTGKTGKTGRTGETGGIGPAGGDHGFAVETRTRAGETHVHQARFVVLAMGYYGLPNRLNVPGEDLPHVSHYYDEAHPYYRRRVVIVGGRNSACETALELYRAGAHVTLVHRGPALGESVKYWVKPDIENRIKEGAIAARFSTRVVEIREAEVVVAQVPHQGSTHGFNTEVPRGGSQTMPADAVLLLTGYHADCDFMCRAGVEIDPVSLEPHHDPETFETNVPGLFIAGGQLAGRRTGSVFIENGRFHGQRIAAEIAKRVGRTAS
jgi:thioredoxin reductase (NADPH)